MSVFCVKHVDSYINTVVSINILKQKRNCTVFMNTQNKWVSTITTGNLNAQSYRILTLLYPVVVPLSMSASKCTTIMPGHSLLSWHKVSSLYTTFTCNHGQHAHRTWIQLRSFTLLITFVILHLPLSKNRMSLQFMSFEVMYGWCAW